MKAGTVIARNIRRLRVKRGIAQEALAVDAGIDRTYVSRLERDLENPTVSVLERLAFALQCDIRELLDPAKAASAQAPLPGGRRKKPARKP
jgi:transcriptional regulator with XRE-family HTH domain